VILPLFLQFSLPAAHLLFAFPSPSRIALATHDILLLQSNIFGMKSPEAISSSLSPISALGFMQQTLPHQLSMGAVFLFFPDNFLFL
jgi:hypothetical protein